MRILLAGESWMTYQLHVKGRAGFTVGGYGEGFEHLRAFAQAAGHEVRVIPNELVARDFPRDPRALADYDVVVLSDLPSDSLLLTDRVLDGTPSADGIAAVCSYVADGGGLVMVGGYMSFAGHGGAARYGSTQLAEVLPVIMSDYDDRCERPAGIVPAVRVPDHPTMAGIEGPWPVLLGYNRVIAKPDAEVVATVGADPLLVVADHGRGRVAAYTSDLSPHWASQGFMGWPLLPTLWTNLLAWTGGTRDADTVPAAGINVS